MLFVQLADFSAERMCARLCAESALPFQIIAAGIVVANAPASGFKQGITYLVGLCLRYEGNQFQQLVVFRFQDSYVLQSDFLGNLEVDALRCVVQVGVHRENHDVVLDSLQDAAFHVVASGNRLVAFEDERMVRYNQVISQCDGFIYHGFGYVQTQQSPCSFRVCQSDLQSGIVESVL